MMQGARAKLAAAVMTLLLLAARGEAIMLVDNLLAERVYR